MSRSNGKSISRTKEDGSSQVDLKATSVATETINRQRQEQACLAATRPAIGTHRFVGPNTSEKDRSENEMELTSAMQRYRQSSGRMFPTWSEVLEVVKSLGYEKKVPVDS
jgi:hypothetical protein